MHLYTKAFLGKSLGFMHVLIQRPSIISESMFISSVVAFRSRSSDYKFPPARSFNCPCNATHGEYGCEHSRDELWRSQVERWSWLLVGGSPPSYQICRVVHGWYVPWEARVGLWIWLGLQEGSSWRHRVLQAVRVPERVDADSGPRRVWVRRVIQPWRSVALESSRAELERIIYPHWTEWNSCTYQCRSNFRHHASGWSSEACDSAQREGCFLFNYADHGGHRCRTRADRVFCKNWTAHRRNEFLKEFGENLPLPILLLARRLRTGADFAWTGIIGEARRNCLSLTLANIEVSLKPWSLTFELSILRFGTGIGIWRQGTNLHSNTVAFWLLGGRFSFRPLASTCNPPCNLLATMVQHVASTVSTVSF